MGRGLVSGRRVSFVGDGLAAVVQGVVEVRALIGQAPVVVGGLAVLARLSSPYRATVDLDVVDRLFGQHRHLEILRAADGAEPVEPAAVLLPTAYGPVKVDVLEVRQLELDHPSDDPGDRLHASAHAWASDTATEVALEVVRRDGQMIEATALASVARDLALHVDLWFVRRRQQALQWIRAAGGGDITADDFDLVAELLIAGAER